MPREVFSFLVGVGFMLLKTDIHQCVLLRPNICVHECLLACVCMCMCVYPYPSVSWVVLPAEALEFPVGCCAHPR